MIRQARARMTALGYTEKARSGLVLYVYRWSNMLLQRKGELC